MAKFSKNPLQQLTDNYYKGYVGLHLEQGVPVLDRDLNLLGDLVAESARHTVKALIGDGTPLGHNNAGKITQTGGVGSNDFQIAGGTFLVYGVQVTIPACLYSAVARTGENLVAPAGAQLVKVYLEVWLDEIDSSLDPGLHNPDDYEIETAVRLKPNWAVRAVQGAANLPGVPPNQPFAGHYLFPLADINRNGANITDAMITDTRVTELHMPSQMAQVAAAEMLKDSLENYLKPDFAQSPFSSEYAYPLMCVTIYGRNLDYGWTKVELAHYTPPNNSPKGPGMGQMQQGQGPTWVPASVIATPSSQSATFQVPPGITGEVMVALTNLAGTTIAPQHLTIYGLPAFKSPGSQFSAKPFVNKNANITLYGSFFDAPGTIVIFRHISKNVVWTWIVQTANEVSCTVKAPQIAGEYRAFVKNFVSGQYEIASADTFIVKP